MYIQILEIATSSLAVISAGFSYFNAKKYHDLSVQAVRLSAVNAEIARARALDSAKHSKDSANLSATAKTFAQKSEDFSTIACCNSKEAKTFAIQAEEHAHTAYVNHLAAKGSMVAAASHVAAAEAQVVAASEQAANVGALSKAVADVAVQTKVRLVHRTDYSTDGSNIGGR